ncbi:hypothetical protein [Streptomyces sp. MA5143a]|uniref:hypothetical protein n=1 Tax=Streptomyces sp. MA5143a TaxID=2083010 RepID=UPI000D1C1AC3|nr:hypothetical protein [Streptomyces sp. MA5143a]SPF02416.1 hypothetical protein SMA5143A_3171 [Streptomyces sp. MA5143a]
MDNGSQAGEIVLVELVVPGIGLMDRMEALEPPLIRRISGDAGAGWYEAVREDSSEPPVRRQVYDWSRLTVGGASRVVWLFLLPFLLINLVPWMQPRLPPLSRLSGWLYDFGARLLGLSLTVVLVGVFGQVAMDQIVWQCAAPTSSPCAAANPLIEAARDVDTGTGLALAALVPLLVGAVLAFGARDAKKEYRPVLETVTGDDHRRGLATGDARRPLEVRGFWEYHWRAEGLTAQHWCAGLLTVAMLQVVPPLQYDTRRGDPVAGLVLFVLVLVLAALVVADGPWFRTTAWEKWWPLNHRRTALTVCFAMTAGATLYCALPTRDWQAARGGSRMLPGMGEEANDVLIAQGVGVLLMVVACLVMFLRDITRGRRMSLYGLLGPVTAVLACFIGWLYTAAFSMWAQGWLTADGDPYATEVPRAVGVIAAGFPLVVVLGGLIVGVNALRKLWKHRQDAANTRPAERGEDGRHLREINLAETPVRAGMGWYDQGLAVLASLIVSVILTLYLAHWLGDGSLSRNVRETTIGTIKQLTSLGTVALIALVAAAVLAVRAVVLRPEMRRNTSIAWAFGVFWPRASHPFAPAAWTARAVPELTHRIKHLLDSGTGTGTGTGTDTRILVHAHSMGAAFAVAALWQIPAELRPRIALLTTGSPISRVFRRHYPGYVTVESLESLVHGGEGDEGPRLCAWTNVYRPTDPLAGPTGIRGVRELKWMDGVDPGDERSHARTPAQPVFWPLERHNGYRRDPRIAAVRRQILNDLVGPTRPSPPAVVPPAPRRPTPPTGPGTGSPDGAVSG